nr:hypothetical protein [Brucella pituitosa]
MRDVVLRAEVIHYRRECWVTPDGKTILAPAGIVGGYGPNLLRLCLMLHAQGQVTMERLSTLLNDIGVDISKRQVVRLLTRNLDGFIAEDAAVLHTGLVSADYVTVDDTGARHARDNFYTTHIGNAHFSVFRTTKTKSRLNFLSLLRGNYTDYVLNDAAFDYLQARNIDPALIARLHPTNHSTFPIRCRFLNICSEMASISSTTIRSACSVKLVYGEPSDITGLWAIRSLSLTMQGNSGLGSMHCAGCMLNACTS